MEESTKRTRRRIRMISSFNKKDSRNALFDKCRDELTTLLFHHFESTFIGVNPRFHSSFVFQERI